MPEVRGRVSQRYQGPRDINPLILVFNRNLPFWIRHDIFDGFHTGKCIFNKTVTLSEVPGRSKTSDLLLQAIIQRRRRNELDRIFSYS